MKKISILWLALSVTPLWASQNSMEKEGAEQFRKNISQAAIPQDLLLQLCMLQASAPDACRASSTTLPTPAEAEHLVSMIASALTMNPELLKHQMQVFGHQILSNSLSMERQLSQATEGYARAALDIERCRQWVPKRLKTDERALASLAYDIRQEESQTPIDIYDRDAPQTGRRLDPGFSFGGTDLLLQSCLSKVSALFDHHGVSPKVLDAGCGRGDALWKFLVAEGDVVAGDNHPLLLSVKDSINVPGKTSLKAKPYLRSDVDIKHRKKILVGDMIHILEKAEYQAFFDVSYSGNFIHCLSPMKATRYTASLYNTHKEGGWTYASAHLPDKDAFDLYRQKIDQGTKFPGYVVENITIDTQTSSSQKRYMDLAEETDDVAPIELRYAHYRQNDGRTPQERFFQALSTQTQSLHRSLMGYDACSFSSLFIRSGFEVKDLFYLTIEGMRVDAKAISEDGYIADAATLQSLARICVIAQKPKKQ